VVLYVDDIFSLFWGVISDQTLASKFCYN